MTTLEEIIADFRSLATIDAEIAKAAAPRLEAIAKKRAAAGVDPGGVAWKPRKKDGGRAYANAAEHVRAESNGNIVTLVLEGGGEYFGQKAERDASLPQRKIIPNVGDALPTDMRDELAAVTAEVLARRSA